MLPLAAVGILLWPVLSTHYHGLPKNPATSVTLEPVDGKPTVSSSALELEAVVPGIDDAKFQEIVAGAKAGCPISRLLKTNITLTAKLASSLREHVPAS